MPVVVTLTMNPAVDVYTSVERVEPTRKLRCAAERRDPGCGGLNVARVARRLGAEAVAIYPAGGLTGQLLNKLLRAEELSTVVVPVRGETRQDFTVKDETTGEEYRFVLPGPRLNRAEWKACLRALAATGVRPEIVCASGSLPPGAPDDFYAQVAELVGGWGCRLALDTSGPALRAALARGVFLIKPNLAEMRELTGAALADEPAMIEACRALIRRGQAEVVALTLGAAGALLVTATAAVRAPPLPIVAVSSVGAGDSFLGGMAWALASKMSPEEALRYAMAAGSAALLASGTELCRPEDVQRLLRRA